REGMPEISTKEIVEQWMRMLRKQGAQKQEPTGLKIEKNGGAPELIGFSSPVPAICCTLGSPGDETDTFPDSEITRHVLEDLPPTGAVRVCLKVAYQGHSGSGVKSVSAHWLTPDGGMEIGSFFDQGTWRPTDDEIKESRTHPISRNFSICIPCRAFVAQGTV